MRLTGPSQKGRGVGRVGWEGWGGGALNPLTLTSSFFISLEEFPFTRATSVSAYRSSFLPFDWVSFEL